MFKKLLSLAFLLCASSIFAQTKIAILPFQNNGSDKLNNLQEGIPSMITSTFATSEKLVIVERSQISKILKELHFSQTEFVDPNSAAEIGKMLGASKVVIGSYTELGNSIRVDAKVVTVETASVEPRAIAKATAKSIDELDSVVDNLSVELLKNFTGEETKFTSNSNEPSDLEVSSEIMTAALFIDGEIIQSDGNGKLTTEIAAGKHKIKVTKGIFPPKTVFENFIDFPGGSVIRAEIDKKGEFKIFSVTPKPSAQKTTTTKIEPQTENSNSTTETVTQKIGFGGLLPEIEINQSVTTSDNSFSTSASSVKTREVVEQGFADLVFFSEEGGCDIYIDGKKKKSMGLAFDNKAEIKGLKAPGTYKLKIEGWEVWYDGTISVNPDEVVKIQIEHDKFEILSRNKN
ncbi:hypothetical protein IT568_10610 [bacterium]|nr:hypothetical protein [bacterium]